jgi:hypothetical protein
MKRCEPGAVAYPGCKRVRVQVEARHRQVGLLQATIASMHGQIATVRTDPSTSSKPPAPDMAEPPTGQRRS